MPMNGPVAAQRTGTRTLHRLAVALLLSVAAVQGAVASEAHRLLVDTAASTLTVLEGQRPLITLHNLSIGRYGVNRQKLRGDNTTPLGRFRVTRVRRDSDFHRFIALDFPDLERARDALRQGTIDARQFERIVAAHRRGKTPPQDTALGGHIGIHGLGRADPQMHATLNWTKGCIALTDRQIDALLPWVRVGMAVEIR